MIDEDNIEFSVAWKECQRMQNQAVAPITGTRVGACVVSYKDNQRYTEFFGGCNVELSISYVYHAEEIAILKSIIAGWKPQIVFCTSKSNEEKIALCGNCRQIMLDANPNGEFVIFNPEGSVKIKGRIDKFMRDVKSWGKIKWEN